MIDESLDMTHHDKITINLQRLSGTDEFMCVYLFFSLLFFSMPNDSTC